MALKVVLALKNEDEILLLQGMKRNLDSIQVPCNERGGAPVLHYLKKSALCRVRVEDVPVLPTIRETFLLNTPITRPFKPHLGATVAVCCKFLGGGAGPRNRTEEKSRYKARRKEFHVVERPLVSQGEVWPSSRTTSWPACRKSGYFPS